MTDLLRLQGKLRPPLEIASGYPTERSTERSSGMPAGSTVSHIDG